MKKKNLLGFIAILVCAITTSGIIWWQVLPMIASCKYGIWTNISLCYSAMLMTAVGVGAISSAVYLLKSGK